MIEPADTGIRGAVIATATPARATLTDLLLRQPSLIITLAYAITALVGVWGSYWYYQGLGVPILEFLQIGDFLVAGLRDPVYGVFAVAALLSSWIANIPYGWRDSQPERYARLRQHWWFRMSYVEMPAWTGARHLPPGTGVLASMVWIMLWSVYSYAHTKAQKIRHGQGTHIAIGESGAGSNTRLLGTTSAWVFVWHVDRREAEALPIESIDYLHLARPVRESAPDVAPTAAEPATPSAASDQP